MNKYLIYSLFVALSWGGYQAYMRQKEKAEHAEMISNLYAQSAINNQNQLNQAAQHTSEMNNDKDCKTVRSIKLNSCIRMHLSKLYPIKR